MCQKTPNLPFKSSIVLAKEFNPCSFYILKADVRTRDGNILTFDLSSILLDRLRNKEGLIYDLQGQMDLDENTKELSFVYFETFNIKFFLPRKITCGFIISIYTAR